MSDAGQALVAILILCVVAVIVLGTVAGVGSSVAMEKQGACNRDVIIHVGGQFPHDVDECTYRARVRMLGE